MKNVFLKLENSENIGVIINPEINGKVYLGAWNFNKNDEFCYAICGEGVICFAEVDESFKKDLNVLELNGKYLKLLYKNI